MAAPLMITIDRGIALWSMDVPDRPMNVITPELQEALSGAIDQLVSDTDLNGAILTSGKSDFMAGGDLRAILDRMAQNLSYQELFQISRKFGSILRKLETCGKPVVAAINGLALGGGCELALACHYRIMVDLPKSTIGLPEATVGLMPGAGGTQRLSRMIGAAAALPILLQGKAFAPEEARKLAIIDEVVPESELIARARDWIHASGNAVQPWDKKGFSAPGGSTVGDLVLGQLYSTTATGIARETQHNRPAPIAILTAVAQGLPLPFDAGMRTETRQFVKIFSDPVARNIIRTQFFNKAAADKLVKRAVGLERKSYSKIGVLGAGLMGSGIALVSALAGLDVVLLDTSRPLAEKGKSRASDALDKLIARGTALSGSPHTVTSRIAATESYSDLVGCELVIEAVFEDRQVKLDVLRKAYAAAGEGPIYASNTSTIPITSLADELGNECRFLGLHFFSPVERMGLVEVIRAKSTGDETLAHALDYVRRLRKTPVVVNDSRGFFTSRVISPYLGESLGMIAEGINPVLIENGAKQAGFPVGPLAMVDVTTIDLAYAAANQAKRDLGDNWVPQPGYPVQKMFVEVLDRKGKRYGKGFYDYPADAPKRLWPGLAEVYPHKPTQPSIEEVKQRMLFRQSLEAVRCLDEGVITDVIDGDIGSTLGIGFPVHTGGVFTLIDTVGLGRFVEICDRFANAYGERWRPSETLRGRARDGRVFYS